jgi:hypothetical protein
MGVKSDLSMNFGRRESLKGVESCGLPYCYITDIARANIHPTRIIRWLKIMNGNDFGARDDEFRTYCAAGAI